MVFTEEQRSSVDSDENYDKKVPALRDFAFDHHSNPISQYLDYSSGSIGPPAFNDACFVDSGYNSGYGQGYVHDCSSTCSHQPPQQIPGGNEQTSFAATSDGNPNFLGIGSNFVADPGFQVSEPDPIPELGSSIAAGPFGYNISPGGLALDTGCTQFLHPDRSRDVYRASLGIPTSNGEADYGLHSLAPSFYQGSLSNPGDFGGDFPLSPNSATQVPSSISGGSKSRRQRKPPESKKKRECPHSDCDWSFAQPKGLKRHLESYHADENTKVYTCKCNYRTSIKSNYQRHLRGRSDGYCKDPDAWTVFQCKCGRASFADVHDQLTHMDACESVNGRVGRPPRLG
ncbi:hypothetical protein PG984_013346 [Apiospora sp. TS-2023a]